MVNYGPDACLRLFCVYADRHMCNVLVYYIKMLDSLQIVSTGTACHTDDSMKAMTSHDFEQYVRQLRPSGSLKKRLTTASLAVMADKEWANSELVAIATKDGGAGIVFVEIDSQLYGTPYELSAIRDQSTGRSKSIICDFCSTWQAGVRASTITFRTSRSSANAIGFLCCADLKCSLHVRDLTESSKTSTKF